MIVYTCFVLNKHQQKTEATKAKLFSAAQRTFAKYGFEAATIERIAKIAGFSRGAFYAHFKTKEDLFLAMLEDRASSEVQRFRSAVQDHAREEWTQIIWQVCTERLRDVQWSLLQLEFKMYIARRGAKGVKIAERYHSLRENIRQQYLKDLVHKDANTQALFEALTDGLSLQRAYKGSLFTERQAEDVMRRAFDLLI